MGTPLFEPIEPSHLDVLRDESRREGKADTVSFPTTEDEVRAVLTECAQRGLPVTTQGSRTGITGGSIPEGGHVLNLSRMKAITGLRRDPEAGRFLVTVQPGVLLADLGKALAEFGLDTGGWSAESQQAWAELRSGKPYFFPPDPTETTASLGGMIACNASGARSLRYGPPRQYVEALRLVLADGSVLALRRGRQRASGRAFSVETEGGRVIEGALPWYNMPKVKNAAGYFAADDMDLVDLFVGSEGTLAVVTEAELALVPAPAVTWGLTAFFGAEEQALRFVRRVREAPAKVPPAAIEFFDHRALALLARQRRDHAAFADLPEPPKGEYTAVYVELHNDEEAAVMDAMSAMAGFIAECGGDEGSTWTAADAREMQKLHDFRHAVPEAVNLLIDERRQRVPGLTKLGTDMAVPDEALERVMKLYRESLEASGQDYVMFGHIGDNHIHVNILPRSAEEYSDGRLLYLDWAREVVAMGGTVAAEHGIGKLKLAFLKEMYGPKGVEEMKAVKHAFDPEFRLNRGNLFEST